MKEVASAIYWKLHTAFLRNNREKAHVLLGMFKDEVGREDIRSIIGPHAGRYEWIRDAIENGTFSMFHGGSYSQPEAFAFVQPPDGKEADFNQQVIKDRGKLYRCLGIDAKASMLAEVDLGEFGRCDFVIREGKTWHCVESKWGMANFSVVSQIDKYIMGLELDMCLGMYNEVKGIVLAAGFSPYVSAELARMGIRMVQHSGATDFRMV